MEGIGKQTNLCSLDLSHNLIGEEGVGFLCQVMATESFTNHANGGLRVDLSQNRMGDAGACRLGKLLQMAPRISELDISGNQITDVGAMSIACGVQTNRYLIKSGPCNDIPDAVDWAWDPTPSRTKAPRC